jgi:hypothetical protein
MSRSVNVTKLIDERAFGRFGRRIRRRIRRAPTAAAAMPTRTG